jgi:hypothetical protein
MQWITREHPKIERIACAWLIARFIDEAPDFLFVPPDDVIRIANETGAIPYDTPGVESLTHVSELCSFDVLLDKYHLGGDPALQLMAGIVRGADTSRQDQSGYYAMSLWLSGIFTDRKMFEYGKAMYDALFVYDEMYIWCLSCQEEAHGSWFSLLKGADVNILDIPYHGDD